MIGLKSALAEALKVTRSCQHPDCKRTETTQCENCNRWFCSDHGSAGGDRQTQEVGMVAQPAACWSCGGFDADA